MGSPAEPVTGLPVALTVAGSDSGGGAGIQADLKVFFALGCHGTSALTALTAQNTRGVRGVYPVPPDFVVEQIETVVDDLAPAAAKTGMLASRPIVEAVAETLERVALPVIVDPVFVSANRDRLLEEDAVDAIKKVLLPVALVVTPNLFEASALTGKEIGDLGAMEDAARELHDMGPRAVLVKGGHLPRGDAVDVFYAGADVVHLGAPRYETDDTHGTGCALSAAIAARTALGDDVEAAVRFAKRYLTGAIRHGLRLGTGFGPMNPGWDLPGAAGGVS